MGCCTSKKQQVNSFEPIRPLPKQIELANDFNEDSAV